MNEKEKMLAGELYDANYNENLIKERYLAKDKCYDYNQLRPSNHKEKEDIIKEIFGKTGNIFTIEQPFMCDYGYNIEIGENFYANHNLIILDGISLFTTLPAPITTLSPIVTPGSTITFPPIHTLFPTFIGLAYSSPLFLLSTSSGCPAV